MTEDNKKALLWTVGIVAVIIVVFVAMWWAGYLETPAAQ